MFVWLQSNLLLCCSALDKLLGQLGIYANWLSSIAFLQKQLCIFIFFKPHFFFCDYRFSYCMKPSGMCLHIYSLPSSAFLKYQTSGFYLPEANLIPLLTFERVHFAKFHFHHSVFSAKYSGLGTDILFMNWSYKICALANKKNQYPTGICLLPKWKRNGPNDTQRHRM